MQGKQSKKTIPGQLNPENGGTTFLQNITIYQITWGNNPEDMNLHHQCCRELYI
jgi:hypothetical protein